MRVLEFGHDHTRHGHGRLFLVRHGSTRHWRCSDEWTVSNREGPVIDDTPKRRSAGLGNEVEVGTPTIKVTPCGIGPVTAFASERRVIAECVPMLDGLPALGFTSI